VISVRNRESSRSPGLRGYCDVLMPLYEGGTKVLSFFVGEIERVK
jgi:hypothetical protein